MPWFKVDDTFAMHEKVMAAGNSAIGLWVRAGAWSMQQLTDGFVPDHVLRALGTPKERRTLVEVSLWEESQGGVQFKNWEERQPTKVQVETARQAAAERQRHARERAKSQRESRRDKGVSHGPPDPTRPVVPNGTTSAAPRKRATHAPDEPTAQTLVAEWIDLCGERPPGQVVGIAAKQVSGLLSEGRPTEEIRAGLRLLAEKRLHPSTLPSLVFEASKAQKPASVPHYWRGIEDDA